MSSLVLVVTTEVRAATTGGGSFVGEDAQLSRATADLGSGALARHVAVGVGLELAVHELVAAEALACIFGAGVGEALVRAVESTPGRGHLLSPPGEGDAAEGAGIQVVEVATCRSPARWQGHTRSCRVGRAGGGFCRRSGGWRC